MLTAGLFGGSGHLPEIHQTAATECGLACLAMIASHYGRQSDLNTLASLL
jgi:ATP-binding cassette subfamily B protein RaxB